LETHRNRRINGYIVIGFIIKHNENRRHRGGNGYDQRRQKNGKFSFVTIHSFILQQIIFLAKRKKQKYTVLVKKFLCVLGLVFLVSHLSACSMKGDGVNFYDESAPYEITIYMQIDADIISADNPAVFLALINEIEQYTNTLTGDDFTNATLTADTSNDFPDNGDGTVSIPLNITIESVKKREVIIESDLFYRYRTTTMFNPFTVLKPVDDVNYYFGLQLENRSSSVPNAIESHQGGNYQYGFHTKLFPKWQETDIVFYDTFANTPAWYITAVLIAGIVGVIVYFVCRKNKKEYN
jgi:hypothetical protein